MIRIWSDGRHAGVLERAKERGSSFAYDPLAPAERAVSVTMPVRVQSWDADYRLLPFFEMNLPEGELRRRITRQFAKAVGEFDDVDLLSIVGRSQIGRVRYSAIDEGLSEDVPFQSVDEILRARRDGGLFDTLLERFARHSGLSGVQPKIMIRATTERFSDETFRQSPTIQSATHIVKMWDPEEYPELAANEFYCLSAANKLGLSVPKFRLSDDGGAIVIDRFDLKDGGYLGFEDFCVLNALRAEEKYSGGYETRLFRRAQDYIPLHEGPEDHKRLFKLFVLNCAVRNGDAHLKNFGVVYDNIEGAARLAPVYDVVTTTAYLPNDKMALTVEGSSNWPDPKRLAKIGQTRAGLNAKEVAETFEATADALSEVLPDIAAYFSNSQFAGVGDRMIAAWEAGIQQSLGLTRRQPSSIKRQPAKKPKLARSDALILEFLRQRNGAFVGTKVLLAEEIDIPQSTLKTAVKRLSDRGLVEVSGKKLTLISREV